MSAINEITGITVLPDESLGGLQREYREVKRKAEVGDLVKYPDNERIARVVADGGDIKIDIETYESTANNPEHNAIVLEPTDIVRIEGERYRLTTNCYVNVGDRVIIVDWENDALTSLNGSVGVVTESSHLVTVRVGDVEQKLTYNDFLMLEPVSAALKTPAPTKLPDYDRMTADIATLARRVAELEAKNKAHILRIQALERRLDVINADKVAENIAQVIEKTVAEMAGVERVKPLTRDEIIEKAKRDVAELTARYTGRNSEVKFVINRDKRTVVALRFYCGMVDNRGKAKCAPDDCFNVHLGKAIALYRALGLDVPDEYLNAPQPKEARIGDIVDSNSGLGVVTLVNKARGHVFNTEDKTLEISTFRLLKGTRILDDSREDSAKAEVSA